MRAWTLTSPGPIDGGPLELTHRPDPEPGPGQVRVRVSGCGVCRTDLHLAEGDLPRPPPGVDPRPRGGRPRRRGSAPAPPASPSASAWASPGWRRRAAAAASAAAATRTSASSPRSPAGTSTAATPSTCCRRRARTLYRLPDGVRRRSRPLRCSAPASSATARCAAPPCPPGGRLGIYGFGGSAHLAAQVALHRRAHGPRADPLGRGAAALALELGRRIGGRRRRRAARAARRRHPVRPGRATSCPSRCAALDRGGTLAIAGIHLSDIPALDYQRPPVPGAPGLRSVTANTRADGEAFLALAAEIPIRPHTVSYPMDRAATALADLAHDRVNGAAVLTFDT